MSDYKSLFKNKKFIYLWLSQIFSNITINILNFTLLFNIYKETRSTLATSMLWVSYALPALIIGPFGAASVDIFDRKKVLGLTNLFQALVVFVYALIFSKNAYISYGVAVIYSIFNQFNDPAEMASLPHLLSKEFLPSANSLFFITQQAAMLIGFGFAGFLIKILGFSKTLILCSIFLVLAFFSTTKLPVMKRNNTKNKNIEDMISDFFLAIWEGYKFIKNNNYILAPLILLLSLNTSLTVTVVNIPAFAKEVFDIPFEYIGILIALPAALGAGTGAFVVPRFLKKGYRKVRLLKNSFILMTLSMFIMIFLIPQLNITLKVIISFFTIYILGDAYVTALIPVQTYLQESIPDKLMGRVFGNYQFLSVIVTIFPIILFGTITEIFGIKMLIFMISMMFLFLAYFLNNHAKLFIKRGFTFSK
ncbi:MFS transporter [Candidatus Woesebacteria bacterium]|nr:MFS transporter [Candidatus Woesebacteria bacterium]